LHRQLSHTGHAQDGTCVQLFPCCSHATHTVPWRCTLMKLYLPLTKLYLPLMKLYLPLMKLYLPLRAGLQHGYFCCKSTAAAQALQ
jgi:hypothetical protein